MDAALLTLDPGTVSVAFAVRWFRWIRVHGTFRAITGAMRRVTTRSMDVAIEVDSASVTTGIRLRDAHLRGPRFLDAPRHPRMLFRGHVTLSAGAALLVEGTLTLGGVDRVLAMACPVDLPRSGDGGVVAVRGTFLVPRVDHGIGTATGLARLNPLLWAIGSEVEVTVTVSVPATMLRPATLLAHAR